MELSTTNITFVLAILGIIFTVYRYFREPQVNTEKQDALLDQRVKYVSESNDRRFKDMQESFNALLLQSNNHIHTVDVKVDALQNAVSCMSVAIAKVETMIDERMPKKQA